MSFTATPTSPGWDRGKLFNAVAEVCMVYGMDETSSQALEIKEPGSMTESLKPLLQRSIKLKFLQLLAPGIVHPSRACLRSNIPSPVTDPNRSLGSDNSTRGRKFRFEDVGLASEFIETFHYFIYPDDVQFSEEELEPSTLPMIFTDIEGNRSYAVGLRFSRPFCIQKPVGANISGHYQLHPFAAQDPPPPNSSVVFVPTCCMVVSQYPCYSFLKDTLSGLHNLVSGENVGERFWEIMQDFAEKLFLVPAPPKGMLAVDVQLPGMTSVTTIMPPRGGHILHRLDVNLNFPFLFLNVDDVLTIVSALLTEQTVIFTSSHYSLPAIIIQCFLAYIAPFEWRHQVFPILPTAMVDLLGAPGINIIGCNANLQETLEFEMVEEAMIVRLDDGQIECKVSHLPKIPADALKMFKTKYRVFEQNRFEVEQLQRLTRPSAVEREQARLNYQHFQDTMLLTIFLELVVRVFYDVAESLTSENRIEHERMMNSKSDADQAFYKQATHTDMFSVFIMKRKQLTVRDDFTLLGERLKRDARRSTLEPEKALEDSSIQVWDTMRRYRNVWFHTGRKKMSLVPDDRVATNSLFCCSAGNDYSQFRHLRLPSLVNGPLDRNKYIDDVLSLLAEFGEANQLQPVCVYLSAHFHVARGDVLRGIDDCERLERMDLSLVPSIEQLFKMVSLLSNEEVETFRERPYYRHLSTRQASMGVTTHNQRLNTVAFGAHVRAQRKNTLVFKEFGKEMKKESLARDAESVNNLFTVLCQDYPNNVSSETFQTFLASWKQILPHLEAQQKSLQADLLKSKPPERVLAISSMRTHISTHCQVVLTTYRVLILTNVGTLSHTFADLRDHINFCKCDIVSFGGLGTKVQSIKQNCDRLPERPRVPERNRLRGPEPFIGVVNNQPLQDVWYRMIQEIAHGWKIAAARKDVSVMEQAECHVKMLMALFQSGLMDNLSMNAKLKCSQKLLSLQSKPILQDPGQQTKEALLYRINPNIHQTIKATNESLLYVPPSISEGAGKLWFGMGSGTLRVYDFESQCFESDLKFTEPRKGNTVRLSRLLLVDRHVWVGSMSRAVHILDVETLCRISQISNLGDSPTDMCMSTLEPKTVWMLMPSGLLLGYNPESCERISRMQVPNLTTLAQYCTCFTIWRAELWVGTNKGTISILNTVDQSFVKDISFLTPERRQVEIRFLAISSEDEIWCSIFCLPKTNNSTFIAVVNPKSYETVYTYSELESRVTYMLPVKQTMWCGTKNGQILVFSSKIDKNIEGPKILGAHDDRVRSMAATDGDLVVSGSASNDGYANVWRALDWFANCGSKY